MANGYLRIKKADIYENNGVTYWKNGANIIGNVVKCVDSDEAEHYYIESLKTRKAILLDDDVKIGGGDYGFESTNGNFILVTTDVVDFSDIGGGNGISITFTFGNKYYTVTTPEDNGDLAIYDPDGEGGETGGGGGGGASYLHLIKFTGSGSAVVGSVISLYLVTDSDTPLTLNDLRPSSGTGDSYYPHIPSIHYLGNAKSEETKAGGSTPLIRMITEHRINIPVSGNCSLNGGTIITISSGMDGLEVTKNDISSSSTFDITFTSDTIMKKL